MARSLRPAAALLAALCWAVAAARGADGTGAPPPSPYGLHLVEDGGAVPLQRVDAAPERLVVLIHGLDDPGWIWDRLVPALRAEGYDVARFEYPNDAPIAASAGRLVDALAALRRRGGRRVDLVAHSMGGLVARDALTRESGYAGRGDGHPDLPEMDRLIMIATPNGGSELARLRLVAEWREQAVRLVRDGRVRIESDRPDAGGAAADLLPGSDFLVELNRRPLPSHTRMTVIAGRILSAESGGVDRAMSWLERAAQRVNLGRAGRRFRDRVDDALADLADSVGDGVVPLASARLDGVEDMVVLDADHEALIHGILRPHREPPAVPVVLQRLAR